MTQRTMGGRFVVGLTGGIGSGKSAVSDMLSAKGVDVVDTDRIAHGLTAAQGAAMPAIRQAFGDAACRPDGSMDRDFIRQKVFSEPDALKVLEAILHPLIRQQAMAQLQAGTGPYALLVVPLLVEKQGWTDMLSAILVVDCPEDLQVSRVQQRSGLDAGQVAAIMAKQASRVQRLAAATHVIVNDADLAGLQTQVMRVHEQFLRAAAECPSARVTE